MFMNSCNVVKNKYLGLLMVLMLLPLSVTAMPDNSLLDQTQRKAFDYFWEKCNPHTGLVQDSATNEESSSIAATGFGLVSICIADERGWISPEAARKRVLATLKTFDGTRNDGVKAEGALGLFYHFLDKNTGHWYQQADAVSTADSANLMAGITVCTAYYKGTEIEVLGDKLLKACEWDKFIFDNQGHQVPRMAMGYLPPGKRSAWNNETGFFGRYKGYEDNLFLINLMAISSPTHPIPATCWYAAQKQYHFQKYRNKRVLISAPPGLAFYLYPHCWLDLENLPDQMADYFTETRKAVQAQIDYCRRSPNYTDGLFGISSCLGQEGYIAYGAPLGNAREDGTITPHAMIGSILFAPDEVKRGMRKLAELYGGKIWGKYGFSDALNPKNNWATRDYLGIDEGLIVLMIENARNGFVQKYFMQNKYIQAGLAKIGFTGRGWEKGGPIDRRPDGSLMIRPLRQDTSLFNYLVIEHTGHGVGDVVVTMPDNRKMRLSPEGGRPILGARQAYYSIAGIKTIRQIKLKGVDPGRLKRLFYTIDKINGQFDRSVRGVWRQKGRLMRLDVTPGEGVHHYLVKLSPKPLRTMEAFNQATPAPRSYIVVNQHKETIKLSLSKPGNFFMNVVVVDKWNSPVEMASSGPFSPDRRSGDNPIVQAGLQADRHYRWGVSSSAVIKMLQRGQGGQRYLDFTYDKSHSSGWDCIEINFKPPLDLRDYQKLNLTVSGSGFILVKLYADDEHQEDVAQQMASRTSAWEVLSYDMQLVNMSRKEIRKIVLFPAPGQKVKGRLKIKSLAFE